jgi:hypothetical protein
VAVVTTSAAQPARHCASPLTERGLAAAYGYRLKVALEQVDDEVQDAILAGLRDLVEAYCPSLLWRKPAA